MRTITIKNKQINLEAPIQFIQGSIKFDNLGEYSKLILNWNNILSSIQSSSLEILPYLLWIPSYRSEDIAQIRAQFFKQFREFIQLKTSIEQNMHEFQALSTQQTLQLEYQAAKQQLNDYITKKQQNDQLSQNSILASKQDLFEKLQQDLKSANQKIEKQQNQFNQNENRMKQLQEQFNTFNSDLETVQTAQRALFKETNQLTKELDELSERKDVYEEKLFEMDPDDNKEDYDRIQEKLNPLKVQYDQLKSQRTIRMQQSKEMQEQIKTFQTSIKETSAKIQKIQPEYSQMHLEYSTLVNQQESIMKRIQEIEPEIARLQQQEKEIHETVHSTKKQSKKEPETSEDIISKMAETDSRVHEKMDQIKHLKQKLSDLGLSNPESPVSLRSDAIEHLKQDIEQTQLKLDELISDFQIEEKVSQITNNLKMLQEFSNIFLASIDFTLRFLLSIDTTSESSIKLEIKLQHKNKELPFNDELKRVEKATVAISLILGILALSKQPIIPIHFDKLPEYIITKQTFLKLLENFRPLIEANPEWMKRNIVFFLTEATPEVSPKIIITE